MNDMNIRTNPKEWKEIRPVFAHNENVPHEAGILLLDSGKAQRRLGWHGVWSTDEALRRTAAWYRDFCKAGQLDTEADFNDYIEDARKEGLEWTR